MRRSAHAEDRGIAQQLFVTHKTVEAHVRSIFRKLDLPATPTENRRVHAVLRFLHACRGTAGRCRWPPARTAAASMSRTSSATGCRNTSDTQSKLASGCRPITRTCSEEAPDLRSCARPRRLTTNASVPRSSEGAVGAEAFPRERSAAGLRPREQWPRNDLPAGDCWFRGEQRSRSALPLRPRRPSCDYRPFASVIGPVSGVRRQAALVSRA